MYDEIIYDKPNKILLKLLGGQDENGNVIEGLEKEISEKLNELKELFL